uniref:Uncharacterized protein n=1 Tax=Coccolithus braarudii TaxID=221442 RepID=A0A7S0L6P5_9EUKA|mmetsp:Transcript_22947/g.49540  ORF Transcript_22947/g.49540 Transcript_22947/m.49540 type:complete len:601 (+) Transcript_22947:144-1946(+)|eukprot:CAMPEP_0183349554 /NCGR_PEP_ID=MMETSP0164_2-20130417/13700_1 /TAXON_ID=221442 /ORGANISM="Coccolithus pelagicus ssp braarudi, Strain PLY182g" /LENGTH=600 /DNA_ID=CAMNT_0025521295 /DNA_START=136 /DNA_END=1938 /DNA_ORIENTATION=+
MEVLRHLLSFVYDPPTDKYLPIQVWENPDDPADFVSAVVMPGRHRRETLYRELVSDCEIVVGPNGRCERDCVKLVSKLYSDYQYVLRSNFSLSRPAMPLLTLDGTGAGLGRGVCHESVGSADFVGGVKQSRATLKPAGLFEGNDHAMPLRENAAYVAQSYNQVITSGTIQRADGSTIPAKPISSADMQGAKSFAGMHETCHSVWCTCQAGEGCPQFEFSKADCVFDTWSQVCEFCKEIGGWVGCPIKTFDQMCVWAHFSPGVTRGGKFTRFKCDCCGYNPTESKWRKDVAAIHVLSDEDQKAARAVHNEMGGSPEMGWCKHYHQLLYVHPMLHVGMDRAGVDQLHLVYLNTFKHLFKYTIHHALPDSKKKLVRDYVKAANFYSYDAASDEEDPVKRWIGREVKRFLEEAHVHLPFLLKLAAAPADVVEEIGECVNADGEQTMDSDSEYEPDEETLAAEESEESLMCSNSGVWDHFLTYVRAIQTQWAEGEEDTDSYRQMRALEAINLAIPVVNALLQLSPTMKTWVPHILLFIVPRQMAEIGDPSRRSCDACESFGAMIKKIIKHLTCRRAVKANATPHHVGGGRALAADIHTRVHPAGF